MTLARIDDPLARAIAPPAKETAAARAVRERLELDAKKHSEAIDALLRQERSSRDKRREPPVKLLLLGQSESGKSTTLKNFQIKYAPNAFRAERRCWRIVIHLNIIRSIRLLLDALSLAEEIAEDTRSASFSSLGDTARDTQPDTFSNEHRRLRMRLTPLLKVEADITKRLAANDPGRPANPDGERTPRESRLKEVFVTSGSAWKQTSPPRSKGRHQSVMSGAYDDDPGVIIGALESDITVLWNDPLVRKALDIMKLRLDELPGFFLNDLSRVTALDYVPTDADVLNARLRTMGVSEHRFEIEEAPGAETGRQWRIFDVGGSRTLRHRWIPYFDDVDAIIFLAPLSAYDQVLEEDPEVNRMADSLKIWEEICSSKLLANVDIILFLNKCDILRRKVRQGIRLSSYDPDYRGPHDAEAYAKYFNAKFRAIHKKHNPERIYHAHYTSVTNEKETSAILGDVRDCIVRSNLRKAIF